MRILYLTPRFPYPPIKGDQVIPYHRLRILSRRHDMALLSLYEREEQLAGLETLDPFCVRIETVALPRSRSFLNVALRAPFSRLPLQVLYFRSAAFRRTLAALVAEENFDLVHGYMLRVAPYLEAVDVPTVLDLVDSMRLNVEGRLRSARPLMRSVLAEELRRVVPYEREAGRRFDEVVVVAERDKALLADDAVRVVPNGVDTDDFRPRNDVPKTGALVFAGNMAYAPNVDGATWFVEECLPRIRKVVPEASVLIAGATPAPEVRSLGRHAGVVVTGFVESMPDVLNGARVALAPVRFGSGMQNKILEAMACALPVVTTSFGARGIEVAPGHELLVADEPDDFAAAVASLLQAPALAEEIGRRARARVLESYSWERSAAGVEEIYREILSGRAGRRRSPRGLALTAPR